MKIGHVIAIVYFMTKQKKSRSKFVSVPVETSAYFKKITFDDT